MIVDLPRPFTARHGAPVLDRVDTAIFHERYFAACMECSFCFDSCCQYGADVDQDNVARLRAVAPALSAYTGIAAEHFFKEWVESDADYPSGRYTRTRVSDAKCVFLNPSGRGCRIHSFSLQQGVDYHELKPLVCSLFPLAFNDGLLLPSLEVRDRDLVCIDQGRSLYDGARGEVAYYFGEDLVALLDELKAASPALARKDPPMTAVPPSSDLS